MRFGKIELRFWPPRKRLVFYLLPFVVLRGLVWYGTSMPGKSYAGAPRALDERGIALRDTLQRHVQELAGHIGPRHLDGRREQLDQARDYLRAQLESYGYKVTAQPVVVGNEQGDNLEAVRSGSSAESFVVGAHYDSVAIGSGNADCPAADDNASGVASTLALAQRLATHAPKRTVRFAFFVNEEPPYFWRATMGSTHYARSLHDAGVKVAGMWSLETMGYYRDEEDTQHYPVMARWLYPDRGNFLAFVGNTDSRALVHSSLSRFRAHAEVPSEGAAMPGLVQGIGWSDHWSFWQTGVPALMLTDTAPFRNPHYHTAGDTPDTLDYATMSRITSALGDVLVEIANE